MVTFYVFLESAWGLGTNLESPAPKAVGLHIKFYTLGLGLPAFKMEVITVPSPEKRCEPGLELRLIHGNWISIIHGKCG